MIKEKQAKTIKKIQVKKPKETGFVKKKETCNAVGRRKRSTARIMLFAGEGSFIVNGKELNTFTRDEHYAKDVLSPLTVTGTLKDYHFEAKVRGGGIQAQLESVRHALSRALSKINVEMRATLSSQGFLKRDPREKERKKFFLVRARKKPQYSKR